MNKTMCGADCSVCPNNSFCKGCVETEGRPFGGKCYAAECVKAGGLCGLGEVKEQIIREINELNINNMPKIETLFELNGAYVNLEYPLPGGNAKFLNDSEVYFGAQTESLASDGRCFGVVAGENFILVSEYGINGSDPVLVMYKRR